MKYITLFPLKVHLHNLKRTMITDYQLFSIILDEIFQQAFDLEVKIQ